MILFVRQLSVFCLIALPLGAAAQAVSQNAPDAPLSVIDWLGERPKPPRPSRKPPVKPAEAPVARSALPPAVTVAPLGKGGPRTIGLVPTKVTGLPQDLWVGSTAEDIAHQLDRLPELHLPVAHSLLFTLLLAQATAPQGDAKQGDTLALARVRTLMEAAALDPAMSLIEQAGVDTSVAHFDLWIQVSLLLGTEDRACLRLKDKPFLTTDYGVRILCAARSGEWDTASLTLGSAQALALLPENDLLLLDRFLNPDLYEGAAPLPGPREMTPLKFRLLEAIGEPQPTRNLPPAYAVADLRDIAGWKAQLEASERLTRIGALPDNRFLGIYTDREPAASGGIWDRVDALQRFDSAMSSGNPEAIAKTLRPAWRAMQQAETEVTFATLYAEGLQGMKLTGASAALRDRVLLLSPLYEQVVGGDTQSAEIAFLAQIARGEGPSATPDIPHAQGIASAFSTPTPRSGLVELAKNGQLGSAILHTIALLEDGARGDTAALRDAISTLRALGLEDAARRAALQTSLLERE